MRLIVGLGNPGKQYHGSRHNVGFACVDLLAAKWGIKLDQRRAKAILGQGSLGETAVVLAKPRTYMNLSGEGLEYLLTRFSASPHDLVVVQDDMDLPLGRIRLRPRGSDAGHNGIRSIINSLGTQEFVRVRIGIGKPPDEMDEISFVIGQFLPEERPHIENAIARAAESVAWLVDNDIDSAMNLYNTGVSEN